MAQLLELKLDNATAASLKLVRADHKLVTTTFCASSHAVALGACSKQITSSVSRVGVRSIVQHMHNVQMCAVSTRPRLAVFHTAAGNLYFKLSTARSTKIACGSTTSIHAQQASLHPSLKTVGLLFTPRTKANKQKRTSVLAATWTNLFIAFK